MSTEAVIVDVIRTPVGRGKPGGILSGVHPVDLLAGVLTALVAWAFAGGEKMGMPVRTASTSRAVQAAVLGLLGVVALLTAGATVLTAALAVGLMVLALMRIRPARE